MSAAFCAHDGCFRPVQERDGYCCDSCHDADGDGRPPEHERGCRAQVSPLDVGKTLFGPGGRFAGGAS